MNEHDLERVASETLGKTGDTHKALEFAKIDIIK